ncbi:hypothetical protein HAX54_009444, partial [Datura stramonium]|nr:hypothetical protein [Datura stramonium]
EEEDRLSKQQDSMGSTKENTNKVEPQEKSSVNRDQERKKDKNMDMKESTAIVVWDADKQGEPINDE